MRKTKEINNEHFIGILHVLQGEEVAIVTTTVVNKNPLTFYGILIDVDENYYYLGDRSGKIDQFIQREFVLGIIDAVSLQTEAMNSNPGVLN